MTTRPLLYVLAQIWRFTRGLLHAPKLSNEEQTQRAATFHAVAWGTMVIMTAFMVGSVVRQPELLRRWLAALTMVDGIGIGLLELNRGGRTQLASYILVVGLIVLFTGMSFTAGGIRSPGVTSYFVCVLIAGLLLGERAGIVTAAICAGLGLGLLLLENRGGLPRSVVRLTAFNYWLRNCGYMAMVLLLTRMATQFVKSALDRARKEIAERKRAEQSLRETKERLQYILDNTQEVIFQIDVKGTYIYGNAAAERFTGYAQSQLLGMNVMELVAPQYRPLISERLRHRLAGGLGEETFEYEILHKDGRRIWAELTTGNVYDDEKRLIGIQAVARDITERKRVAESLTLFRLIVDQANDAIEIIDPKTARFLDINGKASLLHGFTREEYLAMTVCDLSVRFVSGGMELWAERCEEIRRDGSMVFETRHKRKDGTTFPVEINASYVRLERDYVLAVVRDITLRKAHEQEIERLNRLYATLSRVNHTVARCQTRKELFDETCRVMIETAKFQAAYIIWRSSDGKTQSCAASCGSGEGSTLTVPEWNGDCFAATQALTTGVTGVCNGLDASGCSGCFGPAAAAGNGHACAGLPLRLQGKLSGALVLSTSETGFFDVAEVRLVEQIASDISFALDYLEQRESLLASERQFAGAFENSAIGMALVATDGRWLKVNRALCKMVGYTADELFSGSFQDITHPEDLETDLAQVRRTLAGEIETYEMEKRYFHKDGHIVWILLNVTLVHDNRGQPLYFISQIQDITQRRSAEVDLRASEERFRQLAETIEEVFWISDGARSQIHYVSPAYEKIWGRARQALYDQSSTWLDAIHREDRERVRRSAAKNDGAPYEEEFRITRPDGQTRWIRDKAFPVHNGNGQIERVVGVARDTTDSRKMAEQLRQSQKMEAIGLLAGGVAHDFNNILAAMIMQAELCMDVKQFPEKVEEGLEQIRASANRAANLTRQLLLFSRKQMMQAVALDLNEAVTKLAKMLQRIIGEDVRLQLHLHPAPLMIHADAGMLDQVLMNLSVNARDAMPNGGTLLVETKEKQFDAAIAPLDPDVAPGRYACMEVSDTGAGMGPDVLPHIFEPFFTTKEQGKGTGLGLATVFGIVKQHSGFIKAESEPGCGSKFVVFLPITNSIPELPAARQKLKRQGGSETILLVEDEEQLRSLARLLLERQGYRVLEAANGIEAVSLWEKERAHVALLLTDLVMPAGLSGQNLASRLQREKKQLKVVFMTGYSPDMAGRQVEMNLNENFLQKPFSPDRLLEIVRGSLDR